MNLETLDLRLKLDIDSYLEQFETFKFISTLMDKYNNLESVKSNSIMNLNEQMFYHNYTNIYKYLSVLTLKRDYDDTELQFIAELAYRQKGSVEALKTIFDIVDCTYSNLSIENYVLNLNISYNNVRDIYLSQKYLYTLCNDLLFIKSNNLTIETMSIRYSLTGESNSRYVIYTTYDLDSVTTELVSSSTETVQMDELYDEGDIVTTETSSSKRADTDIVTTKSIVKVESDNNYVIETKVENKTYNLMNQLTLDTYEW